MSSATCSTCGKTYKHQSTLYQHKKSVHGGVDYKRKIKCPNPDCEASFPNYEDLRSHICENHDLQCQVEEFKFPNEKDFYEWKQKIEVEMKSFYIRKTASKVSASKGAVYYYVCHRSGYYKSHSSGKRTSKSMGSNKICGHCPSTMKVKIADDVTVNFCKTHYGHEMSLRRLPINRKQKKEIASKIDKGVSFEKILDSVRNDTEELGRIHLLTKKDLHNIKKHYCVSNPEITEESTENSDEIKNQLEFSQIQHPSNANSDIEIIFKKKFQLLIEEIFHTDTKFSVSTYTQAIKLTDKIIEPFRQDQENFSSTSSSLTEPSNIKMELQRKFVPTTEELGRIHLLTKKDLHNIKNEITEESTENSDEIKNQLELSQIQHPSNANSDIEIIFKKKFQLLMEEIFHTDTKFSVSTYTQAIKLTDKIIELFRQDQENFSSTCSSLTEPSNIKMELQRKFVPTKEKYESDESIKISRSNYAAREYLFRTLVDSSSENCNVKTENAHSS